MTHASSIQRWRAVALMLLGAAALLAWQTPRLMRRMASPATSHESEPVQLAGHAMGGAWSIKIPRLLAGGSPDAIERDVAALLEHLDAEMSLWRADSDLSRFNAYRGIDWYAVPADLAEVVSEAEGVSAQTGGAFDVTVAPLVELWGFGPKRPAGQAGQVPSEVAIAAARAHVGYRKLEVRFAPPALRKADPELSIDLGAIAKGYAAGAAAERLDELGVTDYLVAVGGELRARGSSTDGRPWRVGVETPTADVRRVYAQLTLRDASLSTSGDYRNFFEANGYRFAHEIDPRTGRPVAGGLASVSVVHASGARADALATALFVLGPAEGYALAERLDLAALFITRAGDHFDARRTEEFAAMEQSARGLPNVRPAGGQTP